jgi:hypothetical protein
LIGGHFVGAVATPEVTDFRQTMKLAPEEWYE